MSVRRLLSVLAMLALLLAPAGRVAMAQTMNHHSSMGMAGHCDDMPQPDHRKSDKASIDCMIACATLAPAAAASLERIAALPLLPRPCPARAFAGINLTSDPPPPRSA